MPMPPGRDPQISVPKFSDVENSNFEFFNFKKTKIISRRDPCPPPCRRGATCKFPIQKFSGVENSNFEFFDSKKKCLFPAATFAYANAAGARF